MNSQDFPYNKPPYSVEKPPQQRKLLNTIVWRVCELYPNIRGDDTLTRVPYRFGKSGTTELQLNWRKTKINLKLLENDTGLDLSNILASLSGISGLSFYGGRYYTTSSDTLTYDYSIRSLNNEEQAILDFIESKILDSILKEYTSWKNDWPKYVLVTTINEDQEVYSEFPWKEWKEYEKISVAIFRPR